MGVILKGKAPVLRVIEPFQTENGNLVIVDDIIKIRVKQPEFGKAMIANFIDGKIGENIGWIDMPLLIKKTVNVNLADYLRSRKTCNQKAGKQPTPTEVYYNRKTCNRKAGKQPTPTEVYYKILDTKRKKVRVRPQKYSMHTTF